MSEPTDNNATEADDLAAVMAEQTEVEGNNTEKAVGAADDWGAAMAEQEADNAAKSSNSGGKNGALDTNNAGTSVFQEFSKGGSNSGVSHDIDMILDIPVQMTVELGRTRIAIKNLLQLAQGSVVELDGMAGEPMDVLVNGCLIAQGEVVVVNDKFGIRLTDIITPSERIRKLNR